MRSAVPAVQLQSLCPDCHPPLTLHLAVLQYIARAVTAQETYCIYEPPTPLSVKTWDVDPLAYYPVLNGFPFLTQCRKAGAVLGGGAITRLFMGPEGAQRDHRAPGSAGVRSAMM